jgi:hypothetical protein
MNCDQSGRKNYKERFDQVIKSYPHTVRLLNKGKLAASLEELLFFCTSLSQKYSADGVKIEIGEILLNRQDTFKLKYWTELHHPIFGLVFELETYKQQQPFLLTKCEKYLGSIERILGNTFPGVKALKKELSDSVSFEKGMFFELEADVLLLSILSEPYFLKKVVRQSPCGKDVDLIGNWHGRSLKFEVKSLCRSPKKNKTESATINGHKISGYTFEQNRERAIKDIILRASEKFDKGDFNFIVIPDADIAPEYIGNFKCAVEGLISYYPWICEKITAIITYRTDFDLVNPCNKSAEVIEMGPRLSWVDAFLHDFRNSVI